MPVTPFAGSRELCKWLVCELFVLNMLRIGLLSTHAFDAQTAFISFVRHFIAWPVVCKELSGGRIRIFLCLFLPLFLFFYECRRVYSRGPDFHDQGPAFSSQLCVSEAKPLLLKRNHSNLLLWFPAERISSLSFPEWNLWLFCS